VVIGGMGECEVDKGIARTLLRCSSSSSHPTQPDPQPRSLCLSVAVLVYPLSFIVLVPKCKYFAGDKKKKKNISRSVLFNLCAYLFILFFFSSFLSFCLHFVFTSFNSTTPPHSTHIVIHSFIPNKTRLGSTIKNNSHPHTPNHQSCSSINQSTNQPISTVFLCI
jgi:hypothetical protein